jgi:hypothetical protein
VSVSRCSSARLPRTSRKREGNQLAVVLVPLFPNGVRIIVRRLDVLSRAACLRIGIGTLIVPGDRQVVGLVARRGAMRFGRNRYR